jgi:hypothetical protein
MDPFPRSPQDEDARGRWIGGNALENCDIGALSTCSAAANVDPNNRRVCHPAFESVSTSVFS